MAAVDTVKFTQILLQSLRFFFVDQTIKDNERNRNFCLSFIKELEKHYNLNRIGEEWLWNYLTFHRKRNQETTMRNSKNFSPSWVYGKKGLSVYMTRNKEMDWITRNYSQLFDKKKFYAIFPLLEKRKIKQSDVVGYNVQEVYRKSRLNQEDGYDYCLAFTTLYDKDSESCKVCIFKEQCEIDKNIYYKVNGETRTANFKDKVIKSIHS